MKERLDAHLLVGSFMFVLKHLLQRFNNAFLCSRVLPTHKPLSYLRETVLLEMLLENLGVTLVCGEELHQVLNSTLSQRIAQTIHCLIGKISLEDDGDEFQCENYTTSAFNLAYGCRGRTIFDQVLLRQRQQRCCRGELLANDKAGCGRELVSLLCGPPVHVLEQSW